MSYHQDWIMRQIEEMISFISRMVFGKPTHVRSDSVLIPGTSFESHDLYERLLELIQRGEICQAENLLYEHLAPDDLSCFQTALAFYQSINRLTDTALEACDFSREEISQGLMYVCRFYGFDPSFGN